MSSTFSGSMCAQGCSSLTLIMGLLNSADEASVFRYNHMSSDGPKHSFDSHMEQALGEHVWLLQCLTGKRAGADVVSSLGTCHHILGVVAAPPARGSPAQVTSGSPFLQSCLWGQ